MSNTLSLFCSLIQIGFLSYATEYRTIYIEGILSLRFSSAAAAKFHWMCPTLCGPIDGSPPGSPVPGILRARTLEWVAISFSNAWKWKVKVKSLSRVWLLVTPWTAAHQAPPSTGFSRREYWSGVPLPSPRFSGQTPKSKQSRKGVAIPPYYCFVLFFPDQVPSGLSEKLYILAFANACVIGQKWQKDKKFHPEVSHSTSQPSDKKTRSCPQIHFRFSLCIFRKTETSLSISTEGT